MINILAFIGILSILPINPPPPTPPCSTTNINNNTTINNNETRFYSSTGNISNINLNGGNLIVCGNLTINSGNLNNGTIFISSGSSLTINPSISVININIVNYGFVDLRSNNMSFNSTSNIWNYGDSLIISGDGTHQMNGVILNGTNSKIIIESNVNINSSGIIALEKTSIMEIKGTVNNNGTIIIESNSTLIIKDNYTSNSNSKIYLSEYSLIQIQESTQFNTEVIYTGEQNNTAMVRFITDPTIINTVSNDNQIFVCSPQVINQLQLGDALYGCSNAEMYGYNGFIVLPIILKNMCIHVEQLTHVIKWTTYMEINSSHFVLEASDDMIDWNVVEVVWSEQKPNTYVVINYKPKLYYKLIQYDFDGKLSMFGPYAAEEIKRKDNYVMFNVLGQRVNVGMLKYVGSEGGK
jgi:hypothetical protein